MVTKWTTTCVVFCDWITSTQSTNLYVINRVTISNTHQLEQLTLKDDAHLGGGRANPVASASSWVSKGFFKTLKTFWTSEKSSCSAISMACWAIQFLKMYLNGGKSDTSCHSTWPSTMTYFGLVLCISAIRSVSLQFSWSSRDWYRSRNVWKSLSDLILDRPQAESGMESPLVRVAMGSSDRSLEMVWHVMAGNRKRLHLHLKVWVKSASLRSIVSKSNASILMSSFSSLISASPSFFIKRMV